ncbi:hypothetical protein N7535_001113 [Penicillium sp. DV-2018c]|nr:hypothetical protein N7535_001113 [Penicillium sp. DV-2018c]
MHCQLPGDQRRSNDPSPGSWPIPRGISAACPLKTEGLLWAGRRDALPAPGGHRRSDDPVPRELAYLLALPAPGGHRRSNDPVPREVAHSSRHLGGLTPSKQRALLLAGRREALPAPGGPTTVIQSRPPGAARVHSQVRRWKARRGPLPS